MRPDNFEDISAALALYRPGPMGANSHTNYALRKNKQQEITPIHPELEEPLKEILGTTYGLIVYQEQVMAIAQKVAGYSLGGADLLRRAMGKKKKSELDKQYEFFEKGMQDNGYSKEAIKALWDILLPFSDYAFNKAHTAGYGLVSYWTAYLKANYRAEYMAALLTSVQGRQGQVGPLPQRVPPHGHQGAAARRQRLRLRLHPARRRHPLRAARRSATSAATSSTASSRARKEKGRFTDFNDFLRKVPAQVCNKRVIESLIKAGRTTRWATSARAW